MLCYGLDVGVPKMRTSYNGKLGLRVLEFGFFPWTTFHPFRSWVRYISFEYVGQCAHTHRREGRRNGEGANKHGGEFWVYGNLFFWGKNFTGGEDVYYLFFFVFFFLSWMWMDAYLGCM